MGAESEMLPCPSVAAGSTPPSDMSRPRLRAPANDGNETMTLGTAGIGDVQSLTHSAPGSGHMEGKEEARGDLETMVLLLKVTSSLARGDESQSAQWPVFTQTKMPCQRRCHDSKDREGHAPSRLPFQG